MLNFLVETKQEYTTQLVNILTPLIYEGLQSIYNEVKSISTTDNILKNFQCSMQRIPKWNNTMIKDETDRIMNNTKSYGWLEDLIKATLKANIIVLTYNPSVSQQTKIDPILYQNFNITDFIHKIYIECARELWNNPYLFYHIYKPIDLKRNQRETITLIKDCIKEAIRKLLPVKHMLKIYLGEEMVSGNNIDNFDKSISEVEQQNLNKLIQKDLYEDTKLEINYNKDHEILKKDEEILKKDEEVFKKDEEVFKKNNDDNELNISKIIGGTESNKLFNIDSITINGINAKKDTEINDTVGAKILNIINNNNIKLTDNEKNNILTNIANESETSIKINNNQTFQEVFSNSVNKEENYNNGTIKNKAKFFANYLQL
jgi:hypothetical protein